MTQRATRLSALALAVTFNLMLLGGTAYLFNGRLHHTPATALAHLLGRLTDAVG